LNAWRKHRRWFIGQLALWGILAVVLRVAVVPAETTPPVDALGVERAAEAAGDWLERGQRGDGRFLYGYFSDEGRVSLDYNVTRHAGVLDALYRLGRIEAADAGLDFTLKDLVVTSELTAFAPPGRAADVGANSLLTVALMHRREATGERRYDDLARQIGRFLLFQQQADGSILQFWQRGSRQSVPGVFGKFSTGEAFYAYALLNQAFPGEGWDRAAHQVAEYLATRRDEVEGNFRQPDHWAAYGLAALAPAGLTDVEVDYARWLAGYFGYLIRYESQNQRSALNRLTESGASLGTIGEASAALWRLAGEEPRLADLRERLGARIRSLAGVLVDQQVGYEDSDPRARGAWFADDYTQMDDQQHAIAAMIGAEEVLR
jgi:hypothetical protein